MSGVYPTALLKQQNFPEPFKFYFKSKNKETITEEIDHLQVLVRPKLRIAVVTETWPPEINGVALSLLQLCKGLQQKGHKILLIRPEQNEQCHEFIPNRECLVLAQPVPRYPGLKFGWPQYLKVGHALDEFQPQVVHIVTEGPLGLAALQAAKSRNIPVTSGFHSPFHDFSRFFDLAFLVKPIQHYLRWFHNNTQVTCVPSHDTEQALRQFGISCPLKVVGRGVDTSRFSPRHRSERLRQQWGAFADTTVMLYVGRLSPEKEIHVLIDAYLAMPQTQKSKIKLVIVGDGPDQARLQALSANSDVVFTGSLTGHELAMAYASADVFVFASQVETFGNVVLEAMASGLPVVAYDYACARQNVEHGETGWLSPLGQTAHLMQCLYQLPNNRVLRQMGLRAMQQAEKMGWQYPVQQLEQALYQVTQETIMTT